jgi:lysophospholipase L1-like esterase
MKQVFLYGASITHGVGGVNGGWADKLKASFHSDMFGIETGRWYEVYELGIPSQTLTDVLGRFENELKARKKVEDRNDLVVVLSVGLNDSKAIDAIDNHLSSPEDFAANVHSFIHLARDYTDNIVLVGLAPVDESKTNPKENTLSGKTVYLVNDRIRVFDDALEATCKAENAHFVPIFDAVPQDWLQNYVWADGVHPNDAGHEWIRSQVEPKVRELVDPAA